MELRSRWVQFKICDVYIPDPQKLLIELHGDDLLQGKVIDLTDSGTQKEAFIVVEVKGIEQPVIVPAKRVFGVF